MYVEESIGFHVMSRVKDDLEIFGLSSWKDGNALTEMGKTVDEIRLGKNIITSVLNMLCLKLLGILMEMLPRHLDVWISDERSSGSINLV